VCAARNCEQRNNTCRVGGRNTFSPPFHYAGAKQCWRGKARSSKEVNKRLNFRAVCRHASRADGHMMALKNFFGRRGRKHEIKVAVVTMTLTHCHKCAFRVRSEQPTFKLAPWLKGFCAVAAPSHATDLTKKFARSFARSVTSAIAMLIQLAILPSGSEQNEMASSLASPTSAQLRSVTFRASPRRAQGVRPCDLPHCDG
jgi:hypothetical protein